MVNRKTVVLNVGGDMAEVPLSSDGYVGCCWLVRPLSRYQCTKLYFVEKITARYVWICVDSHHRRIDRELSSRLLFAFNRHRNASCSVSFYFLEYFTIGNFSCALRAVFVIDLPSEQMWEEETREVEGHSIPEIYPTPPFRKGKKKTAVSGGIISFLLHLLRRLWLFVLRFSSFVP